MEERRSTFCTWLGGLKESAAHPAWKNPYLRISLLTILFLHIDTIVLLMSNYQLHEFLTKQMDHGVRTFRFSSYIDKSNCDKIIIALAVPLIWFFLNLVTSWIVHGYNKLLSYIEAKTSTQFAIENLRKKLQNSKNEHKESDSKHEKQFQELLSVFKVSYYGLIDLNSYLIHHNKDYFKDFRKWLIANRDQRFNQDLSPFFENKDLMEIAEKHSGMKELVNQALNDIQDPESAKERAREEFENEFDNPNEEDMELEAGKQASRESHRLYTPSKNPPNKEKP